MIAVVDYGMGNLRSVAKALETVRATVEITRDPKKIKTADRLVLPGVGAFADCMANLKKFSLIEPLKEFIASGRPFLGVCLGLQLLFEEGEEFGRHEGLGILKGKVVRLSLPATLKIPHMGWNQIKKKKENALLKNIKDGTDFYFVHSYVVVPKEKSVIATTTHYGGEFVSSVAKDNLFACQFHPEKSQAAGLKLLEAFATGKV
ncbi:MAG: imidazole glycerol phosphate synthase subunit HisH [Deltaproteobacteria bacterium]|nr:imidazole glycerol phosphate synthase subunit HisH [Deltaproteobacteria bacterium]